MSEQKRISILILIMAAISVAVTGLTIYLLYRTAFMEQRERLAETAQSQARLIEAVSRFEAIYGSNHPEGSFSATLSQIEDAHSH